MKFIEALEPRHDRGVLFVHGIGQNKQGQTLLGCAEALRVSIQGLATAGATPAGAGVGAASSASASVSVSAAWLSDPDLGNPARAELLIDGAQHRDAGTAALATTLGSSKWLLAEAWWAEKFPTPTCGEIASWSFGILPATLIAHAHRRFRRVGFRFMNGLGGQRMRCVWITFAQQLQGRCPQHGHDGTGVAGLAVAARRHVVTATGCIGHAQRDAGGGCERARRRRTLYTAWCQRVGGALGVEVRHRPMEPFGGPTL